MNAGTKVPSPDEVAYKEMLDKIIAVAGERNLLKHAMTELNLFHDDAKEVDPLDMEIFGESMQSRLDRHLLAMVALFSLEEHSGSSAEFARVSLNRLLNFEPLGPLTGMADEWSVLCDDTAQNNRCGFVFKNLLTGECRHSGFFVFVERNGNAFTGSQSSVVIEEFPYEVRKPVYVLVPDDSSDEQRREAIRKRGYDPRTGKKLKGVGWPE